MDLIDSSIVDQLRDVTLKVRKVDEPLSVSISPLSH